MLSGRHATPGGLDGVPRFGHVFLLMGENTSLSQVNAKNTPYIVRSLKPRAVWLTNYQALHDGSLSGYIGMTSGQYRPCDVNDDFPYSPNTNMPTCAQRINYLFHQLDAARVSWAEWNESMSNPCAFFGTGTDWAKDIYTTHHNPAVYYDDIEGGRYSQNFNQAPKPECMHKVIAAGGTGPNDMSRFKAALAKGHVTRFNMVIPNGCEQGHDACGTRNLPGQFDAFLRREVPKIEPSPASGASGADLDHLRRVGRRHPAQPPGRVPGHRPAGPPRHLRRAFSPYSLLRTLEDGFGLRQHLRNAAHAGAISIWKG